MYELNVLANQLMGGIVNVNDFDFERIIGKGGFGEVWYAIHRQSQIKCAVKKLFMDQMDEIAIEMYVREIKILADCRHLFLLRLIGFTTEPPFLIVTPFITNGSLFDYLLPNSRKPPLSPTNKTLIAMGVAYGMMKLHEKGIIHRDLKSPNILLDDRLLPYICDFGIARESSQDAQLTKDIGTINWMAPEQMESHTYTNKVDVYSYGMILYEMISHKIPFEGMKPVKIAKIVLSDGLRPPIPKGEKDIKKLIETCWRSDPTNRPTFEGIFYNFAVKRIMWKGTETRAIDMLLDVIFQDDPEFRERAIPNIEGYYKKEKKNK